MSSMREAMPWVASVVDGLRKEFGAETIDQAMRDAVRDGRPRFFAEELDPAVKHRADELTPEERERFTARIGTPGTRPDPERCVSVGLVQLAKGSRGV